MKYSQLKAIFVSSKVTISASKILLSFNTSTKRVQFSWGDGEDRLKGKPAREWTGVFSSTDFPSVTNDGDILEVIPQKEDGLIKIKLSSEEIYLLSICWRRIGIIGRPFMVNRPTDRWGCGVVPNPSRCVENAHRGAWREHLSHSHL